MLLVLLQQVRRDRLVLPTWVLGTAALLAVSAASVLTEYGDVQGRRTILTVALATPALLALRGVPHGASVGSAVHFQSFAFLAVTVGLMNVFLATRHGRADEERGRRELLAATPVGRLTPPLATLLLAVAANAVLAGLAVLGYRAAGLATGGAVISAVALATTGLAFFGVGALASELTPTSRAANGAGTVAVLTAYALRAAGDALGAPDLERLTLDPAWPSDLSPIGWGQRTLAFTEDRWTPVAWLAALAAVTVAAALVVHARRDLGASLLPERSGRAQAPRALRSPLGLAWRQQAPTLLAWAAGAALLGLALGSLVTAVGGADLDDPRIAAVVASLGHDDRGSLARALLPALMVVLGALAAAAGVQAVLRLRDDEAAGRAEELLAAPVSRSGWLLAGTGTGALSVVVVLVATGVAAAVGFAAVGRGDEARLAIEQALVQGPSALLFVAVAALAVAVLPRAATALAWLSYAVGTGWGLLGDALGAPEWADRLSPLATVPALPADEWGPTVVVGLLAAGVTVFAALAVRRRDLGA